MDWFRGGPFLSARHDLGNAELAWVGEVVFHHPAGVRSRCVSLVCSHQPGGSTDPDPSDNVVLYPDPITVLPLRSSIYAVFANDPIELSNMTIHPGSHFEHNGYYGNNWRILEPVGGFTGTFTVPAAGPYSLRVRHGTSSDAGCPNNGYSPVNIFINGVQIASDFDPAEQHGSYWYENDTWTVEAVEGENTLEWVAGPLCTHYWLQRIEFTPLPPPSLPTITGLERLAGGFRLRFTGEPGKTHTVETSTNLVHWVQVTNMVMNTGGEMTRDDEDTVAPQRFYRLSTLGW